MMTINFRTSGGGGGVGGGGGGGVGKHKLCTYRARGVTESPWAGTPSYAKITHLLGSIFVLARTRKKPKRAAFNTPKA